VIASPEIIGQVLPVTIESLERYSLLGTSRIFLTCGRAACAFFNHTLADNRGA
jgi:hypothetical protein